MSKYAYRTLSNHEMILEDIYIVNIHNNKMFVLFQDGKRNECIL